MTKKKPAKFLNIAFENRVIVAIAVLVLLGVLAYALALNLNWTGQQPENYISERYRGQMEQYRGQVNPQMMRGYQMQDGLRVPSKVSFFDRLMGRVPERYSTNTMQGSNADKMMRAMPPQDPSNQQQIPTEVAIWQEQNSRALDVTNSDRLKACSRLNEKLCNTSEASYDSESCSLVQEICSQKTTFIPDAAGSTTEIKMDDPEAIYREKMDTGYDGSANDYPLEEGR